MNEALFAQLQALLSEKKYRMLREAFCELNEVDVAAFIEEIQREKAALVFRTLPKEIAAGVFSQFSAEMQRHIIDVITDQELAFIIEDLFVDDAVDMLEELPANVVKRVLKNADAQTRRLINQFLKYDDNSAGSLMTAEFIDLRKSMTVADAFLTIRRGAFDKETIYTCYVTDESRHLEGVISIKSLFLAKETDYIEDIMFTEVISAHTDDDRESVAGLFSKYGFFSLPVVDNENRLVGIVTVDDAVGVLTEEATEDFEKMAAMLPSERPYLKTGIFTLAKNRILWLFVLMLSGMLTGSVLQHFDSAIAAMPILVSFMPMITGTGGNAGSQISTLVIRGMVLSEIRPGDWLRVLWRELRVSVLVGAVLSSVNFLRIIITYRRAAGIDNIYAMAAAVSLALFATVILAKTIGGLLPMAAKWCKMDPTIMAAPLITTIVDALALVIYFTISQSILPM